MKKAIVLGADLAYMEKVEVTIKSICSHNDNVKFYIVNDDLPTEWFQLVNKKLKHIHSEVINVKMSANQLETFHLPMEHLSYATFFRYFIADFVTEDRALYLDSDIVVTSSLQDLFEEDFEGNALAAVTDGLDLQKFNAGVMLVNTALWREEQTSQSLLELTSQFHETEFGDQGILNRLFKERWKKLSPKYNFMVGMDTMAQTFQVSDWYEQADLLEKEAKIIHYAGKKPWEQWNLNRGRDLWWFYYGLEWSDILLRKDIVNRSFSELIEAPKFHTAIFTNTANLEKIEYLIENLPDVHFSILAHTDFAPNVYDLQGYLNVSLFPFFNPWNEKDVLQKIDFYLDINHYDEISHIIQKVHEIGKPIFGFYTTSHDHSGGSSLFHVEQVDQMVQGIQSYLQNL